MEQAFFARVETSFEAELRAMYAQLLTVSIETAFLKRAKRAVMARLYALTRDAAFMKAAVEDDASEWKRRQIRASAYAEARQEVAAQCAARLAANIAGKNRAEKRANLAALLGGQGKTGNAERAFLLGGKQ